MPVKHKRSAKKSKPVPRRSRREKSAHHASYHKKVTPLSKHDMSLTQLQNMAKSRGIPFGGLTKNHLIKKLNMVA